MDHIQKCVETLILAIKEGEAYQSYLQCEEKLNEQPELKGKIDEFRAAVFRFQNEENGDLFEEADQFEQQYFELRRLPVVNEYLEAELDVCKLLQRISMQIQCGVDLQIPKI